MRFIKNERIRRRIREALSIFFTGIVLIDIVFLAFVSGDEFSLEEEVSNSDDIKR